MSMATTEQRSGPFTLTTTRIVTAAVLIAITLILGFVPNLGFIPIPNLTGSATTEHIPTILGSVLEGPLVGGVTGLTFGLLSFTRATVPAFKDPIVAILPRILIGITPWLVYQPLKRIQADFAAGVAGLVGSLTNSFFVLFFAIIRGYFPSTIIVAVIPQVIAEAILATVATIAIARAVTIVRNQLLYAPDKKDRSKMEY